MNAGGRRIGTAPMRILTVVQDLGRGGTQRVAQNYAIAYQSTGHAAAVLAYAEGGPRLDVLTRHGIPVWIGGKSVGTGRAVDCAVRWRPDVVHVHRPGRPDAANGILEILKPRLPSRHAILETNVFGKVDYSGRRGLVDLHLQLTRWSFWKWSCWCRGLKPPPVGVVMPNLVDTSTFHPISDALRGDFREDVGIPADAVVFGRIGQPLMPKWSPMTFDAFAEIGAKHSHAYLLVVGLPDPLRRRLRRLPASLRDRVVDLPLVSTDDELRGCYGAMDVFLHASAIGESFGMVLAEAMLCGRPVITLSTPAHDNGQVEVVGHGTGGLVVNDRKSMVHAMDLLLADRPLRERLGAEGAASVRARYGLHENIHVLVDLAAIALEAETPAVLRAALEEDPRMTTRVPRSEIEALLARSLGSVSLKDRVLMELVHKGWLYRLYSRFLFPARQKL